VKLAFRSWRGSALALILSFLVSGSMWFYVERVLVAHQVRTAESEGRPRGNLSDLYPRWLGARELLLSGRNPYSPEVTREIQAGYYGRPIDPNRPGDPKDQQGFAYPVYVVFLLAPVVKLPFAVVREAFRWLLVGLVAINVLLWMRTLRWFPAITTKAMLLLLAFGSFGVVQAIELQQLSLLVNALITVCALLTVEGHLFSAGVMLALATIKPQLVWPLAGWLLIWAFGDLKQRQKLIWGLSLSGVVLVAAGEMVLPGWISEFGRAVAAYRQYTGGAYSLLDMLLTPFWGRWLNGVIICALMLLCWCFRREPAASPRFAYVFALVLAATVVVAPTFAPYNQMFLAPAIFLVLQNWERLSKVRIRRIAALFAAAIVGWPWVAALILAVGSLFIPPARLQQAWAVPLFSSFGIPIAVFALLAICVSDFRGAEPGRS
jgi:hypothetical protein